MPLVLRQQVTRGAIAASDLQRKQHDAAGDCIIIIITASAAARPCATGRRRLREGTRGIVQRVTLRHIGKTVMIYAQNKRYVL